MKAVSAKYEKPRDYELKKYGAFDWSFVVETDGEMPHGNSGFGGMLERVSGQWHAKSWSAEFYSAMSDTRLGAIQNCIAAAVDLFAEFKKEESDKEDRIKARYLEAGALRARIENPRIHLHITNALNLDENPKFRLTVEGLTDSEVHQYLRKLEAL